jgi:hypothetical protein
MDINTSILKYTESGATSFGSTIGAVVQGIRGLSNNDDIIEKMHARQRKDLLETNERKKERRRRMQPSNVRQKSIVGFMSLMAVY